MKLDKSDWGVIAALALFYVAAIGGVAYGLLEAYLRIAALWKYVFG